MQHLGRGVHDGYRRLPGAGSLSRKPEKDLQGDSRRSRDRRRHRSPHRGTDPLGAGQHPHRGETADPEHHPANGFGRGHLPGERRPRPALRHAAHPPPALPRHGKRQAGRRLRRNRQIFRHRPRVGAPRAVSAPAVHLLRVDSLPALVQLDVRQPVRHLPDLLFHHVVRRSGGPFGAAETRNERRKNHRNVPDSGVCGR